MLVQPETLSSGQAAWRDRLLPDSIVARMSVVLQAFLLAQALGAGLWAQQIKQSERRLAEISTNLGSRIDQTAQFFTRLRINTVTSCWINYETWAELDFCFSQRAADELDAPE